MEERFEQMAAVPRTISDKKKAKAVEEAFWILLPHLKNFCRSELSRQAKELNERWEGRMARVREAIEKSKYRMAETDDLIYHNGGLDAALAAFDKAAALKD